jgi:hypothetical protein
VQKSGPSSERSSAPSTKGAPRRWTWYSVKGPGERLKGEAVNRNTLIPYFRERHSHGEHLQLTRFRISTPRAKRPRATWVDFDYRLLRSADDLPVTPYDGKGAVFCAIRPHAIAVWSMGPA